MSMPTGDVRTRRPPDHETLVQELRDDGGFPTYRDVLLFAAAIGARFDRHSSFTGGVGDIRFETLTEPLYAKTLVNMIAANVHPEDPEILDDARVVERVRIFEEYANGGLEYIQEQVNTRSQPPEEVVVALVIEALESASGNDGVSVEDLLQGVNW